MTVGILTALPRRLPRDPQTYPDQVTADICSAPSFEIKMTYSYIIFYIFTSFILLFVCWKWYFDILSPPRRLYYLYYGFKTRNEPFSPSIFQEKNDTKRLIYLLPYIAASFTPVILIVRKEKIILSSLGYLYWRILDTFDDLLVGEERKKGLRILHHRLQQLQQNGLPV